MRRKTVASQGLTAPRANLGKDMGISCVELTQVMGQAESPFITTKEAAQLLRITESALRVRVYRRQITAYRDGKRLLFCPKELVRQIKKNRVGYEFGY